MSIQHARARLLRHALCAKRAQRLAALRDTAPPRTASGIRSLLGLAQYCTRCIKDLSTTCAPLRELTKDRVPFELTATHDATLTSLKQALRSEAVTYFKHEWNTVIQVDASPVGLGTILTQENPANAEEQHVVQYASRSLSDFETRYHQTEREALAGVWAMEHFHLYVYGDKFEIVTDNTAVATVINDPRSKPKQRRPTTRPRRTSINSSTAYFQPNGHAKAMSRRVTLTPLSRKSSYSSKVVTS